MRQQTMACHACVDDGDGLTGASAESPNCRKIQAFELT
jgi:hypothetical protein